MKRVGRGCKIHRRRDADAGFHLRRSLFAPLAQQLEDEISAHGISHQRQLLQPILGNQRLRNRSRRRLTCWSCTASVPSCSVPPQLRMFMRTTFMPASHALLPVPITYCESLEPSRPCTTTSVIALGAVRLPVTMAEHLDFGLDPKQPLFRRRKPILARQEVARDGLRVSSDKRSPRTERLAKEIVRARRLGCASGQAARLGEDSRAVDGMGSYSCIYNKFVSSRAL